MMQNSDRQTGKDVKTRDEGNLLAKRRNAEIAIVLLLCALALLPCCQSDSNSPNVAPTTDYPVREASTVQSTSDTTTDTTTQQSTTTVAVQSTTAAIVSTTDVTVTAKLDNATVAQQVIDGKWGNGQDRIDALTDAGYDASQIQLLVNEMLPRTISTTQGEDNGYSASTDSSDSDSQVTWHDEITEPIYENQPVYKFCYTYTFTAVIGKSVSPQVTSSSDYSYDTSADAETAANGSAAQTTALNTIRAAGYDAGNLASCTYTISTSSKQTGTKRVQTGTRVVQQAGWY